MAVLELRNHYRMQLMSGETKEQISRSTKLISKTRFELWLWDINYDWLFHAAKKDGKTMARKLNELIREKLSPK